MYFDRTFGKRFPEAIRSADPPFDVCYHHDPKNKFKFKQDTPDDEWLAKVGSEGWIVLSEDRKWHDETPCIAAIQQHKIGCFYLWGANAKTWVKMAHFMRSCGKISNIITHAPRPFIYHVDLNTKLTRVEIPTTVKSAIEAPINLGTSRIIS